MFHPRTTSCWSRSAYGFRISQETLWKCRRGETVNGGDGNSCWRTFIRGTSGSGRSRKWQQQQGQSSSIEPRDCGDGVNLSFKIFF
ncbi:hypothetical protein OESDEN_24420 [Oesophagostomum dentatum]|uniref:Uncharacterized protein n=1 Tax=Oesophagostomum dentatum TaxID=61180 RepID=A0A0B1RWE7_OESDE|nr:hypothetical protein OESDEN_24420 [Oesophagostomum dentatum]